MRKKITIAFISLAIVLLFAGAISMYELQRLRNQSELMIDTNARNAALVDRLWSSLQTVNSSILRMTLSDKSLPDSGFESGSKAFEETLSETIVITDDFAELAPIIEANREFQTVVNTHLYSDSTDDVEWFLSTYLEAYYKLDQTLKNYLTSPDNASAIRTRMLESSVYKTITPSILTLLVAILIVMMFYYFLDSNYVRPITKLYNSLRNTIDHDIQFAPKFESNDSEINGLRDMIEEITERKNTPSK